MDKPFSQACENNKAVILDALTSRFAQTRWVLEIGSGTGQHAVHFAQGLPHLIWQTSDQLQYHAGIELWLAEAMLPNVRAPLVFTIGEHTWPTDEFDAVFSANTAHIMQRHEVQLMMQQIAKHLPDDGIFCQYGPFTEGGQFNSQSNADFHQHLVSQGYGGYRDLDELQLWADGMALRDIATMPANNLLLTWRK